MFFELRTYDLKPGKAPAYLAFFRTVGVGLVTRHLPMAGYWMAETGRLNRIEHLWVYDSFEERDACRAALATDRDWTEGFVPRAFVDVVAQQNRIMALVASSPGFDAVTARRRQAHPNQSPDVAMFAPHLQALAIAGDARELPGTIARFRTLSGDRPGSHVSLCAGPDATLLQATDGLICHELLRPLSLSPLGGLSS